MLHFETTTATCGLPQKTSAWIQRAVIHLGATPSLEVASGACRRGLRSLVCTAVLGAAGCARDRGRPALEAIQIVPAESDPSARASDPDWAFLRALRDHHAQLVDFVHSAISRTTTPESQRDARLIDLRNDVQTDQLNAMLRREFGDSTRPPPTANAAALRMDSLVRSRRSGYDAAFRAAVLAHDREAVRMIDAYLVSARRSAVRALAESIRQAKASEIASLAADP